MINIFSRFYLLLLLLSSADAISFASKEGDINVYFNNSLEGQYSDSYRNISRSGHNLEEEILKVIKSAKNTLYIAIQELRLPLIAKAIVEKFKQGVDVRVILEDSYNKTINELLYGDIVDDLVNSDDFSDPDHNTSRNLELFSFIDINGDGVISQDELEARDAVYILRKNNIPLIDDTADGSMGSGLMHHKFIIADAKRVIVTSANFTLSDIHGDYTNDRSRGNANSLLFAHSKELASAFTEEFLIMWGDEKNHPRFSLGKPYRKAKTINIGDTKFKVQFSPTSRVLSFDHSVNGLIARTIREASKEAYMALFVFSEQRLSNELKKKYENIRDFKLGALVDPRFAYRNYSELLDMWGIALLDENCEYEFGNNPWKIPFLGAGVPILNSGDMLHHKYAVIDEAITIMGSQNWSKNANYNNDENVLVIYNKRIAKKYKKEFNRLHSNSRIGPPKTLLTRVRRMEEACSF